MPFNLFEMGDVFLCINISNILKCDKVAASAHTLRFEVCVSCQFLLR